MGIVLKFNKCFICVYIFIQIDVFVLIVSVTIFITSTHNHISICLVIHQYHNTKQRVFLFQEEVVLLKHLYNG